jgi:hypothetical protein
MIRLNDKWSVERDKYQWVLYERVPAKKKDGTPCTKIKKRYYPWMSQALISVADKDCEAKTSLEGVADSYIAMQDLIRLRTSDFDKENALLRGKVALLEESLTNAKKELKRLRA